MTAIVAIKDENGVHMGADSMFSNSYTKTSDNTKMFRKSSCIFGCSGRVRDMDLVEAFNPPRRYVGQSTKSYLVSDLVPALKRHLEDGGEGGTSYDDRKI